MNSVDKVSRHMSKDWHLLLLPIALGAVSACSLQALTGTSDSKIKKTSAHEAVLGQLAKLGPQLDGLDQTGPQAAAIRLRFETATSRIIVVYCSGRPKSTESGDPPPTPNLALRPTPTLAPPCS